MNQSDIEFTMGLDTSPAEQKLNQFQSKMRMADAAFDRTVSRNNASFNVIRNSPNYQGFGFEKFNSYDNPLMNAAKKFESVITTASEKLRLQNERTAARREYSSAYKESDVVGMQTASQKFEQAQSGLDQIAAKEKEERTKQREITDEEKAQNREHNESYIKLSKIHKLLLTILAAWQAIKKVTAAAFGRQGELMKETGFLTMDPTGAFHANTDRSYAMIMTGLRHLDKAAPFSMGAFDEVLTKIQTAKERAMAGQGVDDNLSIAVQQLNDTLGTNFNAVQLLTGDPNRSNTEILTEILDSIEKELPKLAEMDEETRSRTIHYIRSLIGPELANALLANLNLNLRTGEDITTMGRVKQHGGSAVTNVNIAEATRKITTAGAELADALEKVKDSLLYIFENPLTETLKKFTTILDTFNALIENPRNFLPKPIVDAWDNANRAWEGLSPSTQKVIKELTVVPLEKTLPGQLYSTITGKESQLPQARFYRWAWGKIFPDEKDFKKFSKDVPSSTMDTWANDLYANPGDISDLFNAQYFASASAKTAAGPKELEAVRKRIILHSLFNAWKSNKLGQFDPNTTLGKLSLMVAGFKGTDATTYSEFENWFNKKGGLFSTSPMQVLDKAQERGDEDIESSNLYNPWQFITKGIGEEVGGAIESVILDTITQEKTGGRYQATYAKGLDGNLHLSIDVYDVAKDGRPKIGSIEFDKPFQEVFAGSTR